MDLKEFKKLDKKFTASEIDSDAYQTKEYFDYIQAVNTSEIISDWFLKKRIKTSAMKVGRHCCTKMTYYLTFDTMAMEINPDAIVRYNKKGREYGIPIHDGGTSYIKIENCPWCGTVFVK